MLPMSGCAAYATQDVRTEHCAIVAQPLASALAQFAQQNNLQLSFDAALAQGKMAPAVSGELSQQQALLQLLSQSGLG
ncbi:hypothetical protein, partial [Pseudomonas viridiflava]|uniref:hypothetical protein n=1 Tax=Pseudomonas viridiflava TaxID=33069 RepID=UPI0013CE6032